MNSCSVFPNGMFGRLRRTAWTPCLTTYRGPPAMAKKPRKKGAVAANGAAHEAIKGAKNPIAALAAQLNKEVGPGTIMIGEEQVPDVDFISTGIATLDAI